MHRSLCVLYIKDGFIIKLTGITLILQNLMEFWGNAISDHH
jgi:hypothetical protein